MAFVWWATGDGAGCRGERRRWWLPDSPYHMRSVSCSLSCSLPLALALSGVTNKPYQRTRLVTAGPDVVAIAPPAQLAMTPLSSLTTNLGVIAHSGQYPTVYSVIRFRGHTVNVVAEGRAPASVDQPKVTQGRWIRPGCRDRARLCRCPRRSRR